MTEGRVGRLLAASLHQAIGEVLPPRLDFYAHWLHSENMRDGSLGVAPITAVLGFLRTEGAAYDAVMARAGTLAAEWAIGAWSPSRRRTMVWLPRRWRVRAALRLVSDIGRLVYQPTRVRVRVKRDEARVVIHGSLFCMVREGHHSQVPLCEFFRAAAACVLSSVNVPAPTIIEGCHAKGGDACTILASFGRTREQATTASTQP